MPLCVSLNSRNFIPLDWTTCLTIQKRSNSLSRRMGKGGKNPIAFEFGGTINRTFHGSLRGFWNKLKGGKDSNYLGNGGQMMRRIPVLYWRVLSTFSVSAWSVAVLDDVMVLCWRELAEILRVCCGGGWLMRVRSSQLWKSLIKRVGNLSNKLEIERSLY